MCSLLQARFHALLSSHNPRAGILAENLALRQQVAVLKMKRPRPSLTSVDRFFWVAFRRLWSCWYQALAIVQPETVLRWHRMGFRIFWRWKSRNKGDRRRGPPRARP